MQRQPLRSRIPPQGADRRTRRAPAQVREVAGPRTRGRRRGARRCRVPRWAEGVRRAARATRHGSGHDAPGYTRQPHHLDAGAAATPDPASSSTRVTESTVPRAPEVIAEFVVDLALVLPRRMTRASPQQCGGAPVRNTQPASSKSAAPERFVVSGPERARCVWLGSRAKERRNRYQYRSTHSPGWSRPLGGPRDHREPRRQRRSTRVRGRARCRGAWGSIRSRPGPRSLRSGSARRRPNTSRSGALRDRRVRSQPERRRPGSPRPAIDPDSLYLPRDLAKAADFSASAAESPGGAGWFSVVGRAGALGRSRW